MKKVILRTLLAIGILVVVFAAYLTFMVFKATSVSTGEPISINDRTETVMLVIDVQEGITGKDASESSLKDQSSTFIPRLNEAIVLADSLEIPVVYIQQQTDNWLLNWGSDYVMAEGAPGVEVDKRVTVLSNNFFTKPYSDSFSNPELDAFFNSQNTRKIFITGLDIAECAGRTARAALNRNYEVVVVEDAVISATEEQKEKSINELKEKGAEIISINQLESYLEQTTLPHL